MNIVVIGAEKTSTTYLQRFFKNNHDAILADVGIDYVFAQGLAKELVECSRTGATSTLLRDFEADADRLLISEFFYRDLGSEERITNLRKNLDPKLEDAKIVLYVRDQVSWLESFYSTSLRVGGTDRFQEFVERMLIRNRTLNYFDNVNLWQSVFGERLKVFEYRGQNLVPELFALFGKTAELDRYEAPATVNSALVTVKQDLVREVNVAARSFEGTEPIPTFRKRIVRIIEDQQISDTRHSKSLHSGK